ncbi:hypothetical protein DYQ86_11565 [Acidobacteria bacterium AB60]|nr:hypothetical protein DYQ86_11565 [Acidobacteria bacterium AB60]
MASAAHVLHVGDGSFHRASVLRFAGYTVDECETLHELAAWFREGRTTDVVCISEEPDRAAEGAIALVRSKSVAPVVLFRSTERPYLQRGVELEFPALTQPDVWLRELSRLIAMTRATLERSAELRASSAQLRAESEAVRRRTQELREQIAFRREEEEQSGK